MFFLETPHFQKKFLKLQTKDKKLSKEIKNTLKKFSENSKSASLRLHKIEKSKGLSAWSMSVNRSIRILYSYKEDDILLHNFGNHDEVY